MSSSISSSPFMRASAVALAVVFAFISLATLAHADTELFTSNPGFETGSTGWSQSTFIDTGASITPVFSVSSDAHTGTGAGALTVTAITGSADAKWLSPAIPVSQGQAINFSDYYKSDVLTSVFVYPDGSGAVQWIGDATPSPSAYSQFHGQSYLVPAGVTSIQIGHALSSTGSLTTDDYSVSLSSAPTQFPQGIVTLTFDDGWDNFYTVASSSLNAHGFKATNYIITGPDGSNVSQADPNPGYMSAAQITELFNNGYDIADHTFGHVDLAKDDPVAHGYADRTAMWQNEITNSIAALKTLLPSAPVDSFAYPYGSYCAPALSDCVSATEQSAGATNVLTPIKASGVLAARSVDEGYNVLGDLQSDNKFKLKMQHVTNNTTAATIQGWVDFARDNKVWLIIMFHSVRAGNETQGSLNAACVEPVLDAQGNEVVPAQTQPDADCTTSGVLDAMMTYLASQPTVSVQTMHQVLTNTVVPPVTSVIAAHADVSVATTSASGENVTYTNPAVTPAGTVTCAPASGTLFALGSTTVTCSSTGAANTTFAVGVTQTVIPVIAAHADVSVATTSATGENVTYTNPTVTPAGTVTCTPVSGTLFALGSTTVTCSSTGAANTTFVVGVAQTETPVVDPTCTSTQTLVNHICVENQTSGGSTPPAFTTDQCWDGIDNDNDGRTDYPLDNSCSDRGDNSEGNDGGSGGGGGGGGGTYVPFSYGNGGAGPIGVVLGTTTQSGSTSTDMCYNFAKTLTVGSTGADVTALQNMLTSNGYYSGPITGTFGPLTKAGVVKFQTAKGLSPVGIVGPLTRALLNACGVTSAPTTGTVLGTSTVKFTLTLRIGSKGDEVTALQNVLTGMSNYHGPITGYFGSMTEAGVKAYQSTHGLPATGIVGPLTRAELNK